MAVSLTKDRGVGVITLDRPPANSYDIPFARELGVAIDDAPRFSGREAAALIAGLGLPGRLRDVAVKPEQLDRIAELSMHDRWIHTNPRKIDGPPVIRELLDAAW